MNNESGCAKIAALLGAIAALVAIVIFVTGKQNISELAALFQGDAVRVTAAPTQLPAQAATFTVAPTAESTLPPPTSTETPEPTPTETPEPSPTPTATPEPTPTPIPDTPADAILEVGQVWRQGNLDLVV